MRAGDSIRVKVQGVTRRARVLSILDRRGREVSMINLDNPPPFTTLVLAIEGVEHRRVCVPLWLEGEAVEVARRVA